MLGRFGLLWMLVVGPWMLLSASVMASVPPSRLPRFPPVKISVPNLVMALQGLQLRWHHDNDIT